MRWCKSLLVSINEILVGTANHGKFGEFVRILHDINVRLKGLNEYPAGIDPTETGATFAENAFIKASTYAARFDVATLADDSGLEVEILDNRPGILSARYGGDNTPMSKKLELLLREIEAAGDGINRNARFVCSVAFVDRSGKLIGESHGVCNGKIAFSTRGQNGFGYDSIFIPDGFDKTFGELDDAEKDMISHRANAVRHIRPYLLDFTGSLT